MGINIFMEIFFIVSWIAIGMYGTFSGGNERLFVIWTLVLVLFMHHSDAIYRGLKKTK